MDTDVKTNVAESRVKDTSAENDICNFKVAVAMDDVEHAGVKQRFRDLPEWCRVQLWKVSGIVPKELELRDELFNQGCQQGAQMSNNVFF